MARTIDMDSLCARYRCAESTIYEWLKKDFPKPVGKVGRANVWAQRDVERWERVHLAGLHVGMEERFEDWEEDAKWARIHANLKRFEEQQSKEAALRSDKRTTKPKRRR